MAATLPIKEEGIFSSSTPSDAELSIDDKRRSPKSSEREHGLLSSEYATATEMVVGGSSASLNGEDWKNTPGGNPNRFHPVWGPPIPRSGMTMSIGNGVTSENIEWDPFFGPPVRKSRGIPALSKAIESGGTSRMEAGLQDNYKWESMDSGVPQGPPRLQVPQQFQIGMNPQQQPYHHQQQQQQLPPYQLQQQQQQYNSGAMQQHHSYHNAQHQSQHHQHFAQQPQQVVMMGQQQQQYQQQQMATNQHQQQQQISYTPPQPITNHNSNHPQQQFVAGNQHHHQQPPPPPSHQQQQGRIIVASSDQKYQQQQQPTTEQFVPPSSGQTLSAQSSLGVELESIDKVKADANAGASSSTPGSSSIDVDAIITSTGRKESRLVQQQQERQESRLVQQQQQRQESRLVQQQQRQSPPLQPTVDEDDL